MTDAKHGFNPKSNQEKTDRQTILVYFAWPTKRPGGHQSQLTMGQSLYAYSAVTAAIRKGQTQL